MRYVLDTTLLIDHSKGRPGVVELVATLLEDSSDLYVCDVVVAEALTGGDAMQRTTIEALIRAVEYVSTAPDAAVWAANSRRQRKAFGARSLADAMIAGVAWFYDATVVTRNPHDFEIQGVRALGYE